MLIKPNSIKSNPAGTTGSEVPVLSLPSDEKGFVNSDEKLHMVLGVLHKNETKHFYSHGTFNSVRLLFHVLEQIGSAAIMMSTYSISEKSVKQLWAAQEKGLIKSIRFLIDNRVRSMSPKPFQALSGFFPDMVRTTSIHAKVTILENEEWKVSIVSSMNATDNNKIERGIISTDPEVFYFDKTVLDHEFHKGAT